MTIACETLVTKEEFEALKSQINKLFGGAADGSEIDILSEGTLAGTILQNRMDLAEEAIQDISIQGAGLAVPAALSYQLVKEMQEGKLQWIKKTGSGLVKPLAKVNTVAKASAATTVQTTAVAGAATAGAATAAASIAVLTSLVGMIGNLGLNIASTRVLGFRIDQQEKAILSYNQDYSNLIRLLSNQNNDLDAANQELQKAQGIIDEQGGSIQDLNSQAEKAGETIDNLNSSLDEANSNISSLQEQNKSLTEQLNNFEGQATEDIKTLKSQATTLDQNLTEALGKIEEFKKINDEQKEELENLKFRIGFLEDAVSILSNEVLELLGEMDALKKDFAEDKEITDIEVTRLESKIIVLEYKLKNLDVNATFLPGVSPQNTANTQTKTLELVNALTPEPVSNAELTITPEQVNQENPFVSKFEELFNKINVKSPEVTDVQLSDLETAILTGIAQNFNDSGLNNMDNRLTNIENNTTPSAQRNNTRQALCDSSEPGGCMANNVTNPIRNDLNNVRDNVGQGNQAIGTLNALMNNSILSGLGQVQTTVTANNALLTNPIFGLQAIKNFLTTAWESTRIGKILDYLTFAITLHNAAMLSRNLGVSIGDAISSIANNSINLIKNEEGSKIDISKTVGDTLEGFLKTTLGVENYNNTKETFTKYNRVVNSASNVIYSINSVQAGLAQGLQTIGNYTGRIGNSLIRSGAVLENSYQWMNENLSVKTGKLGQIQSVLDGAQDIENIASEISGATAEFREAQEQVNQIGAQFKKVDDELKAKEEETLDLEAIKKANSQGAQPTQTDLTPDPKS